MGVTTYSRWGDPPSTNGFPPGFVRRALVDAAGHFAHESPLVGMPRGFLVTCLEVLVAANICVYICKVVYIYADLDMYVYIYMFLHTCLYICIHLYVFTYIYMYSSSIYIYIIVCSSLSFYICYISFTYHRHHYTSHISYMYISYLFTYVHIYRHYVTCIDYNL